MDNQLWKGLIFDILQNNKNRSDSTKSYIHHIAIQSIPKVHEDAYVYIFY